MKTYLLFFFRAFLVLFLMITISFFLTRVAPGDPFSEEKEISAQQREVLEKKYNFHGSLLLQYSQFMSGLIKGDFGLTHRHKNRTVNEIIKATLPPSIYLGILALSLALFFGLSAGIFSALKQDSLLDFSTMSLAVLGISLPAFLIGPLLQQLFSIHWSILPLSGYYGGSITHMILPAFTLSLPYAARIARLTRTGMLDALHEDYIRTARAKGLKEPIVIFRHAARAGLLPVISFLGPAIASITTGTLVVEKIFQIPGMGREFVEAAFNRDFNLILGLVCVYGIFIVICNFLADLTYSFLDPRVKLS